MTLQRLFGAALIALASLAGTAHADRIKDLTTIAGVRENAPVSYTHLTLPTNTVTCRSRWSPYH